MTISICYLRIGLIKIGIKKHKHRIKEEAKNIIVKQLASLLYSETKNSIFIIKLLFTESNEI